MQSFLTSPSRPALRNGLIFGIALGIIEVLFSFISQAAVLGGIGTLIAYGLYILFGFIAGVRASQLTGKTTTGVAAGVWAGLFSSLVSSLVSFILVLVNINSIVATFQDQARKTHQNPAVYTSQTVIEIELFVLVIVIIVALLLGLAGGAIGGAIGKNRYVPTEEYEESFFVPPLREPTASSTETPPEETTENEAAPTEISPTEKSPLE
ncbi:MAG TPA: hypothetical protein VKV20_10895 [Ktedonobacteraceae bacterium]|jgi:hypothetical protein|nr:hypothetical protein [Ktedonobacteraceae bacterium]